MAQEVLLIREGTKLAACDPISADVIAGIPLRETVTATIRRPRNGKHHRLLFALLKVVFDNQTTFPTIEDLLSAIKLATGLFETRQSVDGFPYPVPKSISFAAMDQNRFSQWYEKAVEVILTKILPNVNRADLDAQVHEILDGYTR